MAVSKKRMEYLANYAKEHYKHYYLRLHYEKDKEIMDHLDSQPNKNDYIRQLIAKDIKNQG